MPQYEFRCDFCEVIWEDQCSWADITMVICDHCGQRAQQDFRTAPKTDLWGGTRYCVANDIYASSTGDYERQLKASGRYPKGDKVGGARNESYRNLGKSFSYKGQSKRDSPNITGGGGI